MSENSGGPALDGELTAAVEAWLDDLVRRETVGERLGTDLELATLVQQLVDDDRRRDGVLLRRGKLTVSRLDAHETGLVDLEARIAYPPDGVGRAARVAPGRVLEQFSVRLGATYWSRDELGTWRLIDYVRNDRRMSTSWCTHPLGEDVDETSGLSVVPQAISVDEPRAGRLFLEVFNARDEPVVIRIGRPDRPRGLFRRSPPVETPEVGIPVPANGSTHLVGRSGRLRLTDVEIFAFDPTDGSPVGSLRLLAELPKGHPGEQPSWCTEEPDDGPDDS